MAHHQEPARKRGDHAQARELRKRMRGMPSGDPVDPGFRRLRYARYADDALFGFTETKEATLPLSLKRSIRWGRFTSHNPSE